MPVFAKTAFANNKSSSDSGKLASFDSWGTLTLAIIGAGIFFRLFHFFDNRSLWNDEIFLSSSFLHLGFWELATGPLDHQQKAPFGFLWAVKLSVLLFGKGEMALRLFPLLCGLASLFAFVPVARYFLKSTGALIALAIMALSPPLIYHTVEIKQYGTELLASVLGLLLFVRYHHQTGLQPLLLWGVLGGLLTWFSYSSVFVLAGIGAALSLSYLAQREWKSLLSLAVPFSLWAGAFAVSYFLFSYE